MRFLGNVFTVFSVRVSSNVVIATRGTATASAAIGVVCHVREYAV